MNPLANDSKKALIALLETVIPYLPWQLRLQAYGLLAVLKLSNLSPVSVADAPATVHELIGRLFDQLTAYLTEQGFDVLVKITAVIRAYLLTQLTNAVWDEVAKLFGFSDSPTFTTSGVSDLNDPAGVSAALRQCVE